MTDLAAAIAAIQRNELGRWAAAQPSGAHDGLAGRALAACTELGRRAHVEHLRIVGLLAGASVDTPTPTDRSTAQRIELVIPVDAADVDRAVAALVDDGYRRHHTWSPGAERSLRATGHEIVLARADEATRTVRLRWREAPVRTRWSRLITPTPADWAMFELPGWASRTYHVVRPVRLALERLRLRSGDHADLEPFLVTPDSLIGPLLAVADVGPDDVVVDLGCGDGRIVIAAAERIGCRAIGIERSPRLAAIAHESVRERGLADRVRIVEGDGLGTDLSEATAVLLFLPMVVARRVVPALLDQLTSGCTVVLHEQSRLAPDLPPPDHSEPIVTSESVTVAHRWRVR